jgi:hypothetical protein
MLLHNFIVPAPKGLSPNALLNQIAFLSFNNQLRAVGAGRANAKTIA